jgi:CDP-diacylglycerol---glycerol-3-phosphate 3-phosphatidyltransferase
VKRVDEYVAIGFLAFMICGVIGYLWRVRVGGRLRFARTDSLGDGAVVKQGVYEMGYWWMQPIARTFVKLGFTANGVTWLAAATWLACAILVGCGWLGFACIAGTIAAFSDTLDGLVARISNTSSPAGEILDGTVDRYGDVMVYGGLVILYSGVPVLQVLTLCALAGAMGVSHASSKSEQLRIKVSNGFMRRPERCVTLLVGMGLSGITAPTVESNLHWNHTVGIPLVVGLALIAVIANASAVFRLRQLAASVRATPAK